MTNFIVFHILLCLDLWVIFVHYQVITIYLDKSTYNKSIYLNMTFLYEL